MLCRWHSFVEKRRQDGGGAKIAIILRLMDRSALS